MYWNLYIVNQPFYRGALGSGIYEFVLLLLVAEMLKIDLVIHFVSRLTKLNVFPALKQDGQVSVRTNMVSSYYCTKIRINYRMNFSKTCST